MRVTETKFAPAERETPERVNDQHRLILNNPILPSLLGSLSQMVVLLNKERQIVFANDQFSQLLNVEGQEELIGKRPGEAVGCVYSYVEQGGCGTSEFCKTCGAVNAILESQRGLKSIKECRIRTASAGSLDFQVSSSPFELEQEQFSIFTITDISNEKRRQTLERIFFHDVLNCAGGISGLSGLLGEVNDRDEIAELSNLIKRSADSLIEEIQMQRQLGAAEKGDLELKMSEIKSSELTREMKDLYANHELVKSKNIRIKESAEEFSFTSDRVLLRRILGNMLKNAIEASLTGQAVSLTCTRTGEQVVFEVHNERHIPREIQLQLFQRSFSTKGTGRGIGTYSMKLLGEKYLGGDVWFESSPETGTSFYLAIKK